ncbi:ras GEF [Dentipellis sp. KUC8613]|nr:ras GEF [Dentipellis sp. KUC8613]
MPRQSLRLQIDPRGLPYSPTSPYSSALRKDNWTYESPAGESYERICSVLCLYDFESTDADHLPFRKNEVLEIVKEEDSGWWAAVRVDGSEVGWIPASYVRILSEDAAERVRSVREDTRIPPFSPVNAAAKSAPASLTRLRDSPLSSGVMSSSIDLSIDEDDEALDTGKVSAFELFETLNDPKADAMKGLPRHPVYLTDIDLADSPINPSFNARPPPASHNPVRQTVPGMLTVQPLRLDKSLPASPAPTTPLPDSAFLENNQSNPPETSAKRNMRRRPFLIDDQSSLQRLSTLIQARDLEELDILASPDIASPVEPAPAPRPLNPRRGKIKQLTGDDDAQALYNAKIAQANLPWYLRPKYSEDEIKLDGDGNVQSGTLPALVERLVSDPLRMSEQETFRHAFLTTFHTFATSTEVWDLLISHYEMEDPQGLTDSEFNEWKQHKLRPTQKRVLTVLTMWLEEHNMVKQDPDIPPRLEAFLSLISSPAPLSLTAKHMLISLHRLMTGAAQINTPVEKKKTKVRKYDNYDLLRLDSSDLAYHLSLYEFRLYAKIKLPECFKYIRKHSGPEVRNLEAFCKTHEKLANWVKLSILENDGLNKRANIVDFWIRVAEKCKALHNYSSMSAIVAGLSSVAVSRLHFTWLHSGREARLEPLVKYNAPAGNYSFLRAELEAVDGPCVPFLGMYLKSMVYISDQHSDSITVTPSGSTTFINFVKRQKWYEVVTAMLRFQAKPYNIQENPETTTFMRVQMAHAANTEDQWFWTRSEEVQLDELVHADIRKGLEAAGF